jgi:predicted nuclease of restriction endonuclease-like RecB superfamily
VVLHYLTERDHPWLRALIDEYERGVGAKRSELLARLREPLPVRAPKAKQRLAVDVLEGLCDARVVAAVPPREARWELFVGAASSTMPRQTVLDAVATRLRTDAAGLEAALFADLRSECTVSALPAELSPERIAAEANVRLVSSWIQRAESVRITAWGNTRALVRQARLHGLICNISGAPTPEPTGAATQESESLDALRAASTDGVQLDVSGPLSLFRHTFLYGRALCALVPRALWCPRFELIAVCEAGPGIAPMTLVVRSGDPIRPGRELRPFDSKLEERFAKAFRKAARDWDVVREPRPIEAEGSLIFPDFELVHRRDTTRRFLLEIVGFWTPKYLEEKLRKLRQAKLDNVILCIDEARACGEATLRPHATIIRYKRRIDVGSVLAVLERRSSETTNAMNSACQESSRRRR